MATIKIESASNGRLWVTLTQFCAEEIARLKSIAGHRWNPERKQWQFPDTLATRAVLAENLVRAVMAHGDHLNLQRTELIEKTLYAVDELTGLVIAVAMVRPSKKPSDVDLAAVTKKWKDKAFARGVNREQVAKGAEELGIPLDEHVQNVISALQEAAPALGL